MELFLKDDHYYDNNDVNSILEYCLDQGIGQINGHSAIIDAYPILSKRLKINLNVDIPLSSGGHRLALLWSNADFYNKINISPNYYTIISNDYDKLAEETVELLKAYNNLRIWIDWYLLENQDTNDLVRICQVYEKLGVEMIVGTLYEDKEIDEINVGMVARLKKHLSSNIGLFGNLSNLNLIEIDKRYSFREYVISYPFGV